MESKIEGTKKALSVTIKSFLDAHRKAVFAILDENGLPTTSLMLYAVDDEFAIYFGTRRSFRKFTDIQRQPVISLSVIEERVDPRTVVDIRGKAVQIADEDCGKTCAFFKNKNTSKYYIENAKDFVMFKIVPDFIRWTDASSGELVSQDLPCSPLL